MATRENGFIREAQGEISLPPNATLRPLARANDRYCLFLTFNRLAEKKYELFHLRKTFTNPPPERDLIAPSDFLQSPISTYQKWSILNWFESLTV